MIGQTVSHYKILKKLGTGGMGDVYLAEDTKFNRQVALKFLPADQAADPEKRHRFIHEAKAQALINHPNVAAFHDVQEHENQAFIVMEYVEGRPLSEVVEADRPSLSEVLDYAIQLAEGLEAAHEKGVIHRDVKPDNVLVTAKGHVKILDFGLARWQDATRITKSGTRMGTAAYMSPEQAEARKLDHRSDIFSLGAILYEMVCARRPFEGDTETAVLYEILNTEPEPLAKYSSEAPEELQRIVSKCLAKRTDERYQSASDLLADLKRLKRSLDSGVSSGTSASVVTPKRRRLPYVLTALMVVVVAAALVITNPFQWKVVQDPGAIAAENALAVMYFDNLVDPEDQHRTSDMITSLLIADLSDSEFMRVTNRQRLFDVMNQLGHGDSRRIDRSVATEVATKCGARLMVTGDILQEEPTIIITASISETATGASLGTHRVAGTEDENIFAVVDRLSAAIRKDLILPTEAQTEPDRAVAARTTESADAYRLYLEGLDYQYRAQDKMANAKYMQAIALDSGFAMAYYQLARYATVDEFRVSWEDSKTYIKKATQYIDRTDWKDQQLILARAAWHDEDADEQLRLLQSVIERYPDEKEVYIELGDLYWRNFDDLEGSLTAWEKVVELDPQNRAALNSLAYRYQGLGKVEKALWAINRYIECAPDEPNPYDTRGDLYYAQERPEDAIASWSRALEMDSTFYMSLVKIGEAYIYMGEHLKADSCFRQMASVEDAHYRSLGRSGLALVPMHKGQYAKAIKITRDGIVADRMDGSAGAIWTMFKCMGEAFLFNELGDFEGALAAIRDAAVSEKEWTGDDPPFKNWQMLEVAYLARAGQFGEADSVLADMRATLSLETEDLHRERYLYALGAVAAARNETERAAAYYDSALAIAIPSWRIYYRMEQGKLLLQLGNIGDAAAAFELALKDYSTGRTRSIFWDSEIHYYLGRVYEESGWDDRAIAEYETFLDMWKDADPELQSPADARKRLADLKS